MMTSFSRPLKPETVDQVMLCRVAVPRWGTSSSVRRRRTVDAGFDARLGVGDEGRKRASRGPREVRLESRSTRLS
jgi:hypothetical protein